MTIRCNRIFSIPLQVCGKVVILWRKSNLTMDGPNEGEVPCNLGGVICILYKRLPLSDDDFITGCFFISFRFC